METDGRRLGRLGEVAPKLTASVGLERPVWAAVLDLAAIKAAMPARKAFSPMPKYPASKRDLAVVVNREVTHAEVEEAIRKSGGILLWGVRLFDVFEGVQLGKGRKSLAYALEFRSAERTLQDREVDEALEGIVRALAATLGATLRGGVPTRTAVGRKP